MPQYPSSFQPWDTPIQTYPNSFQPWGSDPTPEPEKSYWDEFKSDIGDWWKGSFADPFKTKYPGEQGFDPDAAAKLSRKVFEPFTDVPSRIGRDVAKTMPPGYDAKLPFGISLPAATEFTGDFITGNLSPGSLGMLGAGGVSKAAFNRIPSAATPKAAYQGYKTARNFDDISRAMSAGFAAEGVENVVDPESTWGERATGGVQALFGALGTRQGIPSLASGSRARTEYGGPSPISQEPLGLPSGPPPRPTTPPPSGPPTGDKPWGNIVTVKSPTKDVIDAYKRQGYVIVPGLKTPEGYAQMVHHSVADMYTNAGQEDPSIFKRAVVEESGEFTPQEMWINLRKLLGREPNVDELEQAMRRQKGPAEQGGLVAQFDKGFEPYPPSGVPETPINPADLEQFRRGIRAEIGEPISPWETPELGPEVPPRPSLPTNVASFPSQAKNLYEVAQGIKQHAATGREDVIDGLMERARYLIANEQPAPLRPDEVLDPRTTLTRQLSKAKVDFQEIQRLADEATNPDEGELFHQLANELIDKMNDLHGAIGVHDAESPFGKIQPLSEIEKFREVPSRGRGIFHPAEGGGRLVRGGPGTVSSYDQPVPTPAWGDEPQLPGLMGRQPTPPAPPLETDVQLQNDIAGVQAANRFKRAFEPPPEQLSMEGQMKDAEIAKYLENESPVPPEMVDLPARRMSLDEYISTRQEFDALVAKGENLTPEDRAVAARLQQQLEGDYDEFESAYRRGRRGQQIQYGDTVEIALSESGQTQWIDNITDQNQIDALNAGIRRGEIEIVQKTGGTGPKNITPNLSDFQASRRTPPKPELEVWDARPYDSEEIAQKRRYLGQLTLDAELDPRLIEESIDEINELMYELEEYDDLMTDPRADKPQAMARDPLTGKAQIGVNIAHSAKELTTGYSKPLPHVMTREGLQNALDAVNGMGDAGKITIDIVDGNKNQNKPATLVISDNGKGMSPDELYTVYTDLHSSGKTGDPTATGGKGVGKATYMLGGDHFEVSTVKMLPNGKKIESSFSGTPIELMAGFDIATREVPFKTPTGTKFKTTLKSDQEAYDLRDSLGRILEYSRNREGTITAKQFSYENPVDYDLKGNPGDKKIANNVSIDYPNNKADLFIPKNAAKGTYYGINVQVLNNGMWQFEQRLSLGEEVNGVPNNVVVDLKPKVEELDPRYPFPVQRESVKENVWNEIANAVKQYIVNPMVAGKTKDLAKLWSQMKAGPRGGTMRETVFFDPGDRLTPIEADYIDKSPAIREVQKLIDRFLDDVLVKLGKKPEQEKLVRTGIYMPIERYLYGHHIPNPTAPKAESAIFVNIFSHMLDHPDDPGSAALAIVETMLHEAAHIGRDTPGRSPLKLSPSDLSDPRVGRYLQTYVNQTLEQGGLDMGHGMDFIRRLGEIYAKTGTETAFFHTDILESIFRGEDTGRRGSNLVTPTGRKSGSYSPEVQELLRIYTVSRGRDAVTEDILSGTGVKSENRGPTGAGAVPGNTGPTGGGTSTWGKVKKATGWGQGSTRGGRQDPREFNFIREALAVPKNATTTLDISAAGRQGLAQVLTPDFWIAFVKQFGAISYPAMKQMNEGLKQYNIMHEPTNPRTQEKEKSFAERDMGITLDLPASEPGINPRAEATASNWLETGGKIPFLSKGYRHSIGYPVRASNRMFLTFLNQLKINRAQKLVDLAVGMSLKGIETGRMPRPGLAGGILLPNTIMGKETPWPTGSNIGLTKKVTPEEAMDMNPYHNKILAREIGDFVNTAVGQAPKRTHALPFKQAEINLEWAAKGLNYMMFSPGLAMSRLRLTNPNTYIMASPFVRRQYLKAALSVAAGWFVFTELIKNAAESMGKDVEVGNDITSADFGKVRVGDTRMDAGGGFLQFLVTYGRLYRGGSTSSSTGQFHSFGEGYQAQTQEDMLERFFVNKLDPAWKFAYDLGNASEYNPFHVADRTMQLFTPLIVQDLIELHKQDPDLVPWLGTAAGFGVGTQSYGKGESVGKLVDPENDWLVQGGGGVRSAMPWNWQADPSEYRDFPWQEK